MGAKSETGNLLGIVKVRNSGLCTVTTVGGRFGTTPVVVMMATTPTTSAWKPKLDTSTHRICGPKKRWKVEKPRAPSAKKTMATSDFDQE